MGSGSSKAKSLATKETPDLSPRKPVANVNKPEPSSLTTERVTVNSTNNNNSSANKQERDLEIASKLSVHENKQSRVEKSKIISGYSTNDSPSALQFDDDSDYNDDIDKILEIPVAVDKSKKGGSKQKKIKQARGENIIGTDRVYGASSTKVSEYKEAPLPETYAQRMQRQQYTFQQNLLVRDKEIVKSPAQWRQESDDEEDVNRGSLQMGFDASKFRAVNRGSGFQTEVFTTTTQGFQTQHDLHSSTGYDLDDLEVKTQENVSMIKQLPQYNQSELDLMRQLEDDLL